MIRELFSLDGAIDRRTFALTYGLIYVATIVFGVGIVVLASLLLLIATFAFEFDHAVATRYFAIGLALVIVVPVLWAIVAAYWKRARNIGVSPALLTVTPTVLGLVDYFLLRRRFVTGFVWPFEDMTVIGGAGELTLLLAMFLAPPHSGAPASNTLGSWRRLSVIERMGLAVVLGLIFWVSARSLGFPGAVPQAWGLAGALAASINVLADAFSGRRIRAPLQPS
ncbi:MAG TPA: hypothetical protein VL460_08835 [Caulobacteraceae bacterium]|jgi:hypothetical protein|nr:hypothetical protein [Caulobacteraceae bacterium]